MEDVTDADYTHAKRVCKEFEIKNGGEQHDLYVQSDTLLLTDVFENIRNISLKVYELYPDNFFTAPGFTWQATLTDIDILTTDNRYILIDIDTLLMVEKGIFIC